MKVSTQTVRAFPHLGPIGNTASRFMAHPLRHSPGYRHGFWSVNPGVRVSALSGPCHVASFEVLKAYERAKQSGTEADGAKQCLPQSP